MTVALAIPTPDWVDFPTALRLVSPPLEAGEVRAAILRAAEDGRLMIQGVSVLFGRGWRRFLEPDDPLWTHGYLIVTNQYGEIEKFDPEIWRASVTALFGPPDPKPVKEKINARIGGRPVEHDWDGARQFIEAHFTTYPLPEIKTRVIEQIEEWFRQHDGPKIPDRREISRRIVDALYGGK